MNKTISAPAQQGHLLSEHRTQASLAGMNLQLSDRLTDRLIAIASMIALMCAMALHYVGIYRIPMQVDASGGLLLGLAWLLRRQLSPGAKLGVLNLAGLAISMTVIAQAPYAPDGYLVVAALMVLSFTNWSGWRAVALPATLVLTLILTAAGMYLGWIKVAGETDKFQGTPEAWLIVCLTIVLLGATMGGAIFELKGRLLGHVEMLDAGQRQLFRYAYQDQTTGLWNHDHLEREIQKVVRDGTRHELLVFEVIGLQQLSALHGPARAEVVWRDLAGLLRECAADNALLCRLPGDQAAIWSVKPWPVPPVSLFQDFKWRAEARLSLKRLGLSIIAACVECPINGADLNSLRKSAQAALQHATDGDDCIAFTEGMGQQLAEEQRIKEQVRDALDQNRFYPAYQAKVDRETHRVVGFEGLARMQPCGSEPTPGPASFIGIMHAEGWMLEFGELMLRKIIADIPRLCLHYGAAIRVAANVSPPLFLAPGFSETLRGMLLQAGVSPANLIVEITEEVFAGDLQALRHACAELRKLNVQVSLDDFGTGFSSLSYLRDVQFDEIKIDQSFVQRIESDERSQLVLSTLCNLGRDFECRVVIEGVETAGQVARINELRGDYVQGYFFARPQQIDLLIARREMTTQS